MNPLPENLLANVTFSYKNSYTGQVQCLSHSRDQKFVTSLFESAIAKGYLYVSQLLDFIEHLTI